MPKRVEAMVRWGREFARAREAAGFRSQVALAEHAEIYVSSSTIAKWELGQRIPKAEDLTQCERILGTNGYLARLLDEWVPDEVSHEWLREWIEHEATATTLLWFETTLVPGILQTEEYAREVLKNEHKTSHRLERQRILERDDAPTLIVLLDESVLLRRVGKAEVVYGQLLHLAQMAERPNIRIHIIPLESEICSEFSGPFVLAEVDGRVEAAYIDDAVVGRVSHRAEDIAALRRKWELFRGDALRKNESLDLIRKAMEKWMPER
ncbi:MAG TPA: helix-turn-helix transcriptional regulator [Streptosporangiaceae bacterium]|jgi:transcriptional regulator with XRE-family HTH domain|nr:helix-turn-helix transcriptional regulator [Streptosporangiaceae bacterium]